MATRTKRRGHGEGTVYFHEGKQLWVTQVTIGSKRRTLYGKTRREVQDKKAELEAEVIKDVYAEPSKILFSDWLERWLAVYVKTKVRPGVYFDYTDTARKHIIPALGDTRLQALTTDRLQEFYNSKITGGRVDGKPGGLSSSRIHRLYRLIGGCLKQAVREKKITSNPNEWTTIPPVKYGQRSRLDTEDVTRYLEAARDHRLYAAFLLELSSGLRRGELLALSWDVVDLDRKELKVTRTLKRIMLVDQEKKSELIFEPPKTAAGIRTVPLLPVVVRALREHKKRQAEERLLVGTAWQDNNLVFCTPIGTPIEPRNFHRLHTELLKKAGLPHVSLHDLRHTFGSMLADTGENPENIRALMGHTKTSTTMDLYCHTSDEGKRKAVNRLAEILGE